MTPVPFDQWVNDNNPAEHLEYGKGWWDYVGVLQRIAWKFGIDHIDVVGTYIVDTPPPQEQIEMPVVRLRAATAELIIKHDFAAFPVEWTISVRTSQTPGTTLGLFDPRRRLDSIPGFEPSWVYPAFADSPQQFSCEVEDEWDLVTLLGLFVSGGKGPKRRLD